MRLINTSTLELKEFVGADIPQYAILSHTWEEEEVDYQDMCSKPLQALQKKGYLKIKKLCELARNDKLGYAWIDTCCIDKSSSAELTEAINSMFQWYGVILNNLSTFTEKVRYRKSRVCYAYLSDLSDDELTKDGLKNCRWFTRGWTLQELIAPDKLIFFDSSWVSRGEKQIHTLLLSTITGIQKGILMASGKNLDLSLKSIPVSTRMSWASNRNTTRLEDIAYCLLGIFDVHMPLLYGEGSYAFRRLQEEIVKKTSDLSLLAWRNKPEFSNHLGALAPSVDCFEHIDFEWTNSTEFTVTNAGLRIRSETLDCLSPNPQENEHFKYAICLGKLKKEPGSYAYLVVARVDTYQFVRDGGIDGGFLERPWIWNKRMVDVEFYLELDPSQSSIDRRMLTMKSWIQVKFQGDTRLISVTPKSDWDLSTQTLYVFDQPVMVISSGTGQNAILFLVVFIRLWNLEFLYILDHSAPAAQYLLHNAGNFKIDELREDWKLLPIEFEKSSTEKSHRVAVHTIHTTEADVTVTVTARVDKEPVNEAVSGSFHPKDISIFCSSQEKMKIGPFRINK